MHLYSLAYNLKLTTLIIYIGNIARECYISATCMHTYIHIFGGNGLFFFQWEECLGSIQKVEGTFFLVGAFFPVRKDFKALQRAAPLFLL